MVSASVGFQCPDCVREGSGTGHGPAASRRAPSPAAPSRPTRGWSPRSCIGLNVALFIAVHVIGDRLLDDLDAVRAGPPRHYGGPPEGVAEGQWYRLVTSMFLHQEVWHIGFNMLGLWWLGGPLEAALGRARYLALYLLSGLGGSALTYCSPRRTSPRSVPPARSSACFGRHRRAACGGCNYDMRPVLILLALNLLFTFTWADIAWQAHVGGLVAGPVIAIRHGARTARAARAGAVRHLCAGPGAVIVVVVARTAAADLIAGAIAAADVAPTVVHSGCRILCIPCGNSCAPCR